MLPPDRAFRSALPDIVFPAVAGGQAAELLALNRQFDDSQWWPLERMAAAQFRQLGSLVAHAAREVPFYARRLRDAGIDPGMPLTAEVWQRLPILTRRDVQRQGTALHAAAVPPSHGAAAETATGGSTGIPVRVRKTALDNLMWNAIHVREELWHREDPLGDIVRLRRVPSGANAAQTAAIWSADGLVIADWGPPIAGLWRTGRMLVLESTQAVEVQADFILRHGAPYIFTNPSNLRLLLAYFRDRGVVPAGLLAVWTISEAVDDSLRALCRAVFGTRIVHNYSAAETGYMALQCPSCDHFHVQSEVCRVEVVDAEGAPVAPGETGRVIVTPLHNFAMPLLRYEIGDQAELGPPCSCGRGLPVLTRIAGRILDVLTLPDGRRRRTDFNHYRLSGIQAVHEYQIIQRSRTRIEIMLVTARPLTAEETATVQAIMAAEFTEGFTFDISEVASIKRTEAGKLRPFLSDLPPG